ncbi:MAG: Xaa-Pro peptidase family protein [Acidobacteriota bacterium]|nr:Xaa-Pro peptidase family protein [Acidobacteriota bacterium]
MHPWPRRKQRTAAALRPSGAGALLLTHLPDVRWLCGFTGSNAAVVLLAGPGRARARLFTDGRYTTQAKAEALGTPVSLSLRSATAAACEWMAAAGVTRCGFDETHTTVAALDALRAALPAPLRRRMFAPVGPLVARLREIKDALEIETMRAAAALGCRLFDDILGYMEPGMSEAAVAAELERRARRAGAEAMSFDTIVAGAERSALPHGRASQARLPRRGFCTLDFGVVLRGYCSDMTRTVHLGKATPEEHRVYEAVLEAQQAGVRAVADGVPASDVDEAARSVLRTARLDRWFTHSTGHGVGIEIHEGPRLARKPDPAPPKRRAPPPETLKTKMVVTIEPGVYLPGRFGVRIEDTVLVTRTGCEILTPCTKAWIEL